MNKHCDSVSIEKAYELMDLLGIRNKSKFARLCGVTKGQFFRWEQKGKMPAYRLAFLKETIITQAKQEFDDVVNKILKV